VSWGELPLRGSDGAGGRGGWFSLSFAGLDGRHGGGASGTPAPPAWEPRIAQLLGGGQPGSRSAPGRVVDRLATCLALEQANGDVGGAERLLLNPRYRPADDAGELLLGRVAQALPMSYAPPAPPPPTAGGGEDASIGEGSSAPPAGAAPGRPSLVVFACPSSRATARRWYHLRVTSIQIKILTWLRFPYVFESWYA
jgi:hypothetical protein